MIIFFKDIYLGFKNSKLIKKIIYISLIFIYLTLLLLPIIKVNKEIMTPGGFISNVSTNKNKDSYASVHINSTNSKGEIYAVGVRTYKRVSVFEYLISKFSNDLAVDNYIPGTSISKEEEYIYGVRSKDISINNALIVAYTEANKVDSNISIAYEYEGVLVALKSKTSNNNLKVDDVITHVNNLKITSQTDFISKLETINGEESFVVTVNRKVNEKVESLDISVKKQLNKDTNKYVLGIYTFDYFKIDEENTFPSFEINKDYNSIGGSGGTILTLAIYNALTSIDITNGKKIMGTGTMEIWEENGIIINKSGEIGGIEQKIVTASLYNIDIFFVDAKDYNAAINKANEIDAKFAVIKVDTFTDLLDYLNGEANE